jgi:SagB-type dehydrogenase family enzyme
LAGTRSPNQRRLRRARSLALHLRRGRLVLEDFLRDRRHAVNEDALSVLRRFEGWRTVASAVQEFRGYDPRSVRASIAALRRKGLLVAEGTAEAARDEALAPWAPWSPAGTCFHFATRNTRYATSATDRKRLLAVVTRRRMPPIYKDVPGPRLRLGPPSPALARGSLGDALVRRRTCREFRRATLPRPALDAVTVLSFGRLGLLDGGPYGTLLRRSAPSGGARHAVECYVMVLDVAGLGRGLYHYSVRDNALVRMRSDASRDQVTRFTWGQAPFADASAVFLMTAVFARSQWKYLDARAYRVLLLDLGHICQNVLLVATSLGLGAFCTAALDDKAIDGYLGLDGVSEGVLYMAGIGLPRRPRSGRLGEPDLAPGHLP